MPAPVRVCSAYHESVLTEARVRLVCNEILIRRACDPRMNVQLYLKVWDVRKVRKVWVIQASALVWDL